MKKVVILIAAVFTLSACTNKSGTSQVQDKAELADDLQDADNIHLSVIDTTFIKRDYDEKDKCVKVSYKGRRWEKGHSVSVSYEIPDAGTPRRAQNFIVNVNIAHKGEIKVSRLEIETENKRFSIAPTLTAPMDNIVTLVFFNFVQKEMIEAMDTLAHTGTYAGAKVFYDSSSLTLPLHEVQQIRYMARSYRKDGGKF
jgi:hypothetical protein